MAGAALDHRRQRELHAEDHAAGVDRELALRPGVVLLEERPDVHHARVVDEDVQRAELLLRGGQERGEALAAGHVERAAVAVQLAAARIAASPSRSPMATRAPRPASSRAVASPMPRAPPVIAATRPGSGRMLRRMRPDCTFTGVMDWEAEGLLDGVEGDRARRARRALLDELYEGGVPLEELCRAVAEDRLALLPVERVLASKPDYSAREVAERSGMDLEYFIASRRALGFPVPDPDEKAFTDQDVESAKLGVKYLEAGFAADETIEVTRVLGQGMARYVEATRTMAARAFLEPGIDERELAHRYAAVAEGLLPQRGAVARARVPPPPHAGAARGRGHARAARDGPARGREARRRSPSRTWSGSPSWGRACSSRSWPAWPGGSPRWPERVVGRRCRIVKQIGDAVMLVSPEVEPDGRRGARARRGRRRRRRASRRCVPASPTARRSTAGATGTARRSTWPAG